MAIMKYDVEGWDNISLTPTKEGFYVNDSSINTNLVFVPNFDMPSLTSLNPFKPKKTKLILPYHSDQFNIDIKVRPSDSKYTGCFVGNAPHIDDIRVIEKSDLDYDGQLDILNNSLKNIFIESMDKIWEQFLNTSYLPKDEISKLEMISIFNDWTETHSKI